MKFSFKRGEKINSMTLEYPITAWVKTTRFFWVSVKPGRQALYRRDRPRDGTSLFRNPRGTQQAFASEQALAPSPDVAAILENL